MARATSTDNPLEGRGKGRVVSEMLGRAPTGFGSLVEKFLNFIEYSKGSEITEIPLFVIRREAADSVAGLRLVDSCERFVFASTEITNFGSRFPDYSFTSHQYFCECCKSPPL
jgi:hypothetical protein